MAATPVEVVTPSQASCRDNRANSVLTRASAKAPLHVPEVGVGDTLHRLQPDVGQTGVHPALIKAIAGLYGAIIVVFWISFGRGEALLALGIVTILGTMFFGLLTGMTLAADAPDPERRSRSLAEFLNGRVITYTGWISGREAALQMLTLPVLLVATAVVLSIICAASAH